MLAYVFWHWSAPGTTQSDYESRLRAFHCTLAANPPEGFISSAAFRIQGAPWLPQPNAYEDWYLVEDFASLGTLNDAAVSGARRLPHDDAARVAGGGTAGVYRLVGGRVDFNSFRCEMWLTKPPKTSYEQFFQDALPWTQQGGAALWQRQMTLGPATEFCLQSAEPIAVPERFAPTAVLSNLISAVAEQSHRRGSA